MDALSYWEHKHWLSGIDFAIVGSGIVGINCALALREKHPKAKIVIFEKGILPKGASTKNAGFSCFGSVSEMVLDLEKEGEEAVFSLVQKRFKGVALLRKTIGDQAMDYQQLGGHEVFLDRQSSLFENCAQQLSRVNTLLSPIFKGAPFDLRPNSFEFKGVLPQYMSSSYEGQIDTGLMMKSLIHKAQEKNILIWNGVPVTHIEATATKNLLKTPFFECEPATICLATNGFSQQFGMEEVLPARAQVLITKPIKNLAIKGVFHLDEGYYYFRNIDGRVLLGGGRNLDFKGEQTLSFDQSPQIQEALEKLLTETILPHTPFEIEHRWSGIMGVGSSKQPLVKNIRHQLYAAVRLGGMGVALGAQLGHEMADLCS